MQSQPRLFDWLENRLFIAARPCGLVGAPHGADAGPEQRARPRELRPLIQVALHLGGAALARNLNLPAQKIWTAHVQSRDELSDASVR